MTPVAKQKTQEIREIVTRIRNHPNYTPELALFLENIIFFVLDFEYEEFEHVKEWLTMYDIQEHRHHSPFQIYPPIHPDYLMLKNTPFDEDFQKIKDFFQFVRTEIKEAGG